jgi:xanthine/uracil permease
LVFVIVWREWKRPTREVVWAIVAYAMFYVIFVSVLLVDVTSNSSDVFEALIVIVGLLYTLIAAALCYRVFVHARLIADPSGLTIANPFRGNQHLAWSSIATMSPDRLLTIHDAAGKKYIAWVVQKNGWARWHHERTDADDTIDELAMLAGRALGTGPRSFVPVVVSPVAAAT